MKSHWSGVSFILIALFFSGCATARLEKTLAQNAGAIGHLSASSVEVTLRGHSIYDEPFRFRLNKAMRERYVHTDSTPAFEKMAFVINDVSFEDKGASFVSGGAAGGNSLHGILTLTRGGVSQEIRIDKEFNTGGGYTIMQDWEDRMIKAVLVDIDKAIISSQTKL